MSFLTDKEIASAVSATPSLAGEVDPQKYEAKEDAIQACSLDLNVGDIFDPSAEADKPGGINKPLKNLSLSQGATAVVRTREKLVMPDDIGGIAFPPSHVSIGGLLMTNPGHVDPGYDGQLHLTVINMGSKPYALRSGDRIVRVLLFKLNQRPAKSYRERRTGPQHSAITEELLSHLSSDFVDVTKRADESAKREVGRAQLRMTILVPMLAAVTGALITYATNRFTEGDLKNINQKVDVLNAKVDSLGGNVNLGNIQRQIDDLKKKSSN